MNEPTRTPVGWNGSNRASRAGRRSRIGSISAMNRSGSKPAAGRSKAAMSSGSRVSSWLVSPPSTGSIGSSLLMTPSTGCTGSGGKFGSPSTTGARPRRKRGGGASAGSAEGLAAGSASWSEGCSATVDGTGSIGAVGAGRAGRGAFETVGCDGLLKGLSPTAPCAKASPVQPAAPASAVATRPAASANFGTAARRPLIAWDRGPDGLPDTLRAFCTLRITGNRLSIAAGPETPLKTTPLK